MIVIPSNMNKLNKTEIISYMDTTYPELQFENHNSGPGPKHHHFVCFFIEVPEKQK